MGSIVQSLQGRAKPKRSTRFFAIGAVVLAGLTVGNPAALLGGLWVRFASAPVAARADSDLKKATDACTKARTAYSSFLDGLDVLGGGITPASDFDARVANLKKFIDSIPAGTDTSPQQKLTKLHDDLTAAKKALDAQITAQTPATSTAGSGTASTATNAATTATTATSASGHTTSEPFATVTEDQTSGAQTGGSQTTGGQGSTPSNPELDAAKKETQSAADAIKRGDDKKSPSYPDVAGGLFAKMASEFIALSNDIGPRFDALKLDAVDIKYPAAVGDPSATAVKPNVSTQSPSTAGTPGTTPPTAHTTTKPASGPRVVVQIAVNPKQTTQAPEKPKTVTTSKTSTVSVHRESHSNATQSKSASSGKGKPSTVIHKAEKVSEKVTTITKSTTVPAPDKPADPKADDPKAPDAKKDATPDASKQDSGPKPGADSTSSEAVYQEAEAVQSAMLRAFTAAGGIIDQQQAVVKLVSDSKGKFDASFVTALGTADDAKSYTAVASGLNDKLHKPFAKRLDRWGQVMSEGARLLQLNLSAIVATPGKFSFDSKLESEFNRANAFANACDRIQAGFPAWKGKIAQLGGLDTEVGGCSTAIGQPLTMEVALLRATLTQLDDLLSGFTEDTEQESIQLFYFGSVPEVMKALNLQATQYTDGYFETTGQFDTARKALTDAEAIYAMAIANVNDLTHDAVQLGAQVSAAQDKVNKLKVQIQSLNEQIAALPPAATTTSGGSTTSTTDGGGSATTSTTGTTGTTGGETGTTATGTTTTGTTATGTTSGTSGGQNPPAGSDLEVQRTKLNGDLATAQGEQTQAQSDLTAVMAKLQTAQSAAATARTAKNKDVVALKALAAAEVAAFRHDEDHHAFWFSRARRTSEDPVRRCELFGYDHSNILFIRGRHDDIAAVKEIVAAFDRPAPQALVTLYSMQINAAMSSHTSASRLAQQVSQASEELTRLQGNLTILQDVLRNSISKEVDRHQRISHLVYANVFGNQTNIPSFACSDRMWRSFFYPREIRRALGMDVQASNDAEDNDSAYLLSAALDDLTQAKDYYQRAETAHLKVMDYVTARTKNKVGSAGQSKAAYDQAVLRQRLVREAELTHVEDHFRQAGLEVAKWLQVTTDGNSRSLWQNKSVVGGKTPSEALSALARLGNLLNYIVRAHPDHDSWFSWALRLSRPDHRDPVAVQSVTDLPQVPEEFPADQYPNPYDGVSEPAILADCETVRDALKTCLIAQRARWTVAPDQAYVKDIDYVTRFTLPDPAHGTTFGEMLFVLSLGSRESRARILHDFSEELFDNLLLGESSTAETDNVKRLVGKIQADVSQSIAHPNDPSGPRTDLYRLACALVRIYGNAVETRLVRDNSTDLFPYFPRTVFGSLESADASGPSTEGLTPNQREILSAIQTRTIESVTSQLSDLADQAVAPDGTLNDSASDLLEQAKPLVGYLSSLQYSDSWSLASRFPDYDKAASYQSLGEKYLNLTAKGAVADIKTWNKARMLLGQVRTQNALSRATPRVAAADEMIKRFITVLQGDMDHFLIRPTLDRMRMLATGKGIEFGGMQVESILATNRLASRVDVNATASLGSEEIDSATDISQQLGNLVDSLDAKTRSDRGKNLGTVAALAPGAVAAQAGDKVNWSKVWKMSVLGALLGAAVSEDEPLGEVYALNGGAEFRVTPIFDPSGQAMRFQLDHVETVNIQDPAASRNPSPPRVDRHSINTEVQLANGQFQVVSSYDLNAKIGLPARKSGGIPPFNNVPLLRDLPIIGYFVKREPQAAVRQHSLIFANTVMYPTVSDIVNLLVDAPPTHPRTYRPAPVPKADPKPKADAVVKGR